MFVKHHFSYSVALHDMARLFISHDADYCLTFIQKMALRHILLKMPAQGKCDLKLKFICYFMSFVRRLLPWFLPPSKLLSIPTNGRSSIPFIKPPPPRNLLPRFSNIPPLFGP
ncbi:hypothetical protein T07_9984 [Trichinella nelsoni]|uniref:Uncharacterized protein n=1 Tax=Trichinella nelsoni TaxID=6336 RepID=A0A0V0RKH4_9BILA|nr:hypothetical protein T07_9984 [Trichinella nelsoni]